MAARLSLLLVDLLEAALPAAICRCSCIKRAVPPPTYGVAWLVPLMVVYPVKPPSPTVFVPVVVMMLEPGALMVGSRFRLASLKAGQQQ